AYNIQFYQGGPVLIDTLSFIKYRAGSPWIAYRQFCQHFLCPLALAALKDVRLSQLLRIYIDGIPLDIASKLLPWRMSLFHHIHLHALSQAYFQDKRVKAADYRIGKMSFLSLVDDLESAVTKLGWRPKGTVWGNYYDEMGYSTDAFEHKKNTVSGFLDTIMPRNCWDLGANTGVFSRIAADKGIQTFSIDSDPAAVEKNYLECREKKRKGLLPLLVDLTNPSPGIGWLNEERAAFIDRGPVDVVMALALIHHLVISGNLTFDMIAEFFSRICGFLIVEFIPKDDPQVKRLLASREDIFGEYSRQSFELWFNRFFSISGRVQLRDSGRFLYLMKKRDN
ncbi:MAG: SAM-dependent methyltransferase, partial [Candidatus Omnitrophota bacterium]